MSIKILGKQSLIYGFGHILSRLATFLLLPLYTNHFTPSEYGIIALFYTIVPLLNIIVRYGMGAAFLKNYVISNDKDRVAVFTNVLLSLMFTGIPFLIITYLFKDNLSQIFFGVTESNYIIIMSLIIFFDSLSCIPMLGYRAENKPNIFIMFSLLNAIINMTFNFIFVLLLKMSIEGVFLGNLVASVVLFVFVLPFIIGRFDLKYLSRAQWRVIVAFAVPFLPAGLFAMLMEVADRYILKILTNLETVGIYSAGYKVGVLMLLIANAFNMGWQPYFLGKKADFYDGNLYPRIITIVLSILGFFWLSLLFFVDDLISIKVFGISFFGPDFLKSLDIIPIVALSYFFYGFYLLQTPGMFLQDLPKYAAWTRLIGATTNIILCFLLIPRYGAMGAAYSTCISFMVMSVSMYFINITLIPVRLELKKIMFIILFMALGFFLFHTFNDLLIINVFVMLTYVSGIAILDIINISNFRSIFRS